MNPLEKSYLFEIVNRGDRSIEASFTLVIPPSSVRIQEPQRVSITRTFSNAIIDDYGPDNLQITISGNSGTARAFPTFRSSGGLELNPSGVLNTARVSARVRGSLREDSGYTQRSAFYTFRDEIIRYKDRFENFEDKELIVYDLGDEQAYRCVLLDFTLDRSAENPLQYPYSISLFAYERVDSPQVRDAETMAISRDPFNALQRLDSILNAVLEIPVLAAIQELSNRVQSAITVANLITARLQTTGQRLIATAEQPLVLSKQLVETLRTTRQRAATFFRRGNMLLRDYASFLEGLASATAEAMGVYGFAITIGRQREVTTTIPINGTLTESDLYVDTGNLAPSANPQSYTYSRVRSIVVKEGDTLQTIANRELGDMALWIHIAILNNLTSNSELAPGDTLFLPVQQASSTEFSAFILSEKTTDQYGTDMQLDSRRGFAIAENGDYATVSGLSNIIQAIDSRLNTKLRSMIKHTAFGIATIPGRPTNELAVAYTRSSLKASLFRDPRIAFVRDIGVTLREDGISITARIGIHGLDDTIAIDEVL